jgi:hypothetical protein
VEVGAVSLLGMIADRLIGPRIPADELPYPLPPGVEVRRNALVPRVGGWLMGGDRRPARGVAMGPVILVPPGSRPTDDLIVHELVHVEQWRADPLFLVRYVARSLRHGYRDNPYEVEAYARQREYIARRTHTTHPPRIP